MSLLQSLETAIKTAIDSQSLGITGVIARDSQTEPAYPYFLVQAVQATEDPETTALTVPVVIMVIDDALDASSTIEVKTDSIRAYIESATFRTNLETNLSGTAHVGLIHSWTFESGIEDGQRIEATGFQLILT